jgi:hypothetical protein
MDLTPVAATVPAPVAPATQPVQSDPVKQQKLAEAQSTSKQQSVVYFSPVIRIDRATSTAIFQYRDKESGEVTREVPSESELQAYLSKDSPDKPVDDDAVHIEEDA